MGPHTRSVLELGGIDPAEVDEYEWMDGNSKLYVRMKVDVQRVEISVKAIPLAGRQPEKPT